MDQRDNREYGYAGAPGSEEARRYGEGDYAARRGRGEYGQGYGQDYRADRGRGYGPTGEAEYGQRGYWRDDEPRGEDRGRMGGAGDWRGQDWRGQGGYRDMGQQPRHEGWRADRWGGEGRGGGMDSGYGAQGGYGSQGGYGTMQPVFSYTEVWLMEGPHTGRGPRNYQRSDERIKEEACERLTRHGQVDASDIDVEVRDGEVMLRGEVGDRRMKRLAEEAVESVPGVRDVQNQIRVRQGQASWGRQDDALVASRPGGQGQPGGTPAAAATGTGGSTGSPATSAGGTTATADDSDWQRQRGTFQQHFTSRQASTGGSGARRTWEEAEPNYRFGYDAARSDRYRGRRFDEAEPDLRRDYEERRHASGRGEERRWEELREEVREGFERLRTS